LSLKIIGSREAEKGFGAIKIRVSSFDKNSKWDEEKFSKKINPPDPDGNFKEEIGNSGFRRENFSRKKLSFS